MAELRDRRNQKFNAISTVNAPAKKGGAGGCYTWGTAMDVMDYQPVGTTFTKVHTAAAPMYTQTIPAAATSPMTVNLADAGQFPALGSIAIAPAATSWGPPGPLAIPTQSNVAMSDDRVRSIEGGFDAQHPRNTFARLPRTSVAPQTVSGAQQFAIDWTQAGTTSLQQVALHAGSNAAHLSPYVQPAQQVPLSVLQQTPQVSARQFIVPAANRGYQYQTTNQTKPGYVRPMVLQARGR
jgi:hypothetical protein|eukprot:TRINITY_DN778_c0_g1_i2.p1 TRINITY_DN778_c0_g1~~TRINITY_DN778_c0_g1_i2.p1  ORF type:complete len:261 (-),score=34.31 TRINITY_DN778_c0_g1_i2:462-1175(-)